MALFQIPEFYGIQQHKAGVLLDAGTCSDCRNVDTLDGNLKVGCGFAPKLTKVINGVTTAVAVPGTETILKLIIARGVVPKWYVVTSGHIYAWDVVDCEWDTIHTFSTALTSGYVDFIQLKIGLVDYVIVATGCTQMLKINLSTNVVTNFGESGTPTSGTVSSYDDDTKTVTLSATLTTEQARRCIAYGLYVKGIKHDVMSASGTSVVLEDNATDISAGDVFFVLGGGSDAHCNYVDYLYSRLFSAGDPDAPCRLYWSALPGDGRSIEDWLEVDADADASGGYVEIGESSGDPIVGITALSDYILIFKRFSVYRLYGSKPSVFTLERVEENTEKTNDSGVLVFSDIAYWPTVTGLKYYSGETIQPFDSGVRVLKDFLKTVRTWSNCKSCACDNVWYFTCRIASTDGLDNTLLVYDTARKAFTVRDGFSLYDICHHDGNVYLVDSNRIVEQWGVGRTYNGANIDAYWDTQITDLGNKLVKKQIKKMFMQCDDGKLMVDVHSGGTMQVVDRISDSKVNDGFVVIPVSADRQRTFYFRLYNEYGSYFNIIGGIDINYESENSY